MSASGEGSHMANRRGGYGDGGGLTLDNKLPLAEPLTLPNEAALRREFDLIGRSLGSTIDWVERIQALIRLESLIRGGATQYPCCIELLRNLKDPLVAQICDRRSAVSRQACHVISVLVSYIGIKFDHLAVLFIPVLVKVLTITVQVMAEAADECIQSVLHHCRSGKLLPKVSDFIFSDKSSKIRLHCIKYLLQVFECWNPKQYERYVEFLYPGVRSSLQDASSEIREVGRTAVAALYHCFPEKGKAFVKSLDDSLHQKIALAIRTYKKKDAGLSGFNVFESSCQTPLKKVAVEEARWIQSLPQNISLRKIDEDPSSSEGSLKDLQPREDADRIGSPVYNEGPSRVNPDASSKTFTFPTLRQETPDVQGVIGLGHPGLPPPKRIGKSASASDAKARRNQNRHERTHPYARIAPTDHDLHKAEDSGPQRLFVSTESPEPRYSQDPSNPTSPAKFQKEGKLPSLQALLKHATSQGFDWRVKEDTLDSMIHLFEQKTVPISDLSQSLQSLVQVLHTYLQDPHHRVVALTQRLISTFIESYETFAESVLPKLASVLFAKLMDGKGNVRSGSASILQSCMTCCSVETLLGVCISCLASIRIPKAIPDILNYSCSFLNDQNASTVPGGMIRQWICRLSTLIHDKNAATRKAATEALEHCLRSIPQQLLKEHLSLADPQEQLTLVKNLRQKYSAFLPNFSSAQQSLQREGSIPLEQPQRAEVKSPLPKQDVDLGKTQDQDNKLLESLYYCRNLKEVEKLDALTSLTERLCYPAFTSTQSYQSEILEECLSLFFKSKSAVREQLLMLLNDMILQYDTAVSLKDFCTLFSFLVSVPTNESDLVCLAMDIVLDTLLGKIPPYKAFDLCLSAFSSLSLMTTDLVPSHFLRLSKVLTRLICFLDHKLVEKKFAESNFQIVQYLIKQWNSERVDIRKAVVCCLAQIGHKIPQRIEVFLKDVKESDKQLLYVYIQKIEEK